MAESLSQAAPQFAAGFPNFNKEREGEMKFGASSGYGMDFTAKFSAPDLAEVSIWGRVLLLPPSVTGQTNGLTIIMLATSDAPEIKSLDDLGVTGELPAIIQSFAVGK